MKSVSLRIWSLAAALTFPFPAFAATVSDFEAGLQGWHEENPPGYERGAIAVQSAIVKAGKQALKLSATAENSLVRLNGERISITESRNLAFKGWYRLQGKGSVLEIRVRSYDANGAAMLPWQDYFQFHHLPEAAGWSQFEVPLSIHADAKAIDITLTYSGGAGEAYFDDIGIVSIPVKEVASAGYVLSGIGGAQAAFSVESPLKKIYPNSKPPQTAGKGLALSAAKGESEAIQLVIWPKKPLKNLQVKFADWQGAGKLGGKVLQARYVGNVDIKRPDSLGRSGPNPDPLFNKPPGELAPGTPQSVWVNVHVPRTAKAGNYTSRVVVSAEGLGRVTIPLTVQVYNFELPQKPTLNTLARLWNFPVEGQDGPPAARSYFRANLRDHRISGEQTIAELPIQVSPDGSVKIDWSKWDKAAPEYFDRFGLTLFNVPHVYLGNWKGFDSKTKDGRWFGLEFGSPVWKKAFGSYCKQVADHLRKQGHLKHALWQIWDEPAESHAPTIRMAADIVHSQAKDARIYVVTHLQPALFGAVDVWCVPSSVYDKALAAQRRAAGDEIWIYENLWYQIDIDETPFRLRSSPWTMYHNDVTGLEWWAVTFWETNPYIDTRQSSGKLTNGNGFLLYPDHETRTFPISTVRWEAYRDGMDDYDYLTLLAGAQDRALQKLKVKRPDLAGKVVVKSLTQNMFTGTFAAEVDVKKLVERRQKIAGYIERLQREPGFALKIGQ